MTDPIADMLTQIRNAFAVGKEEVILPHSKAKLEIAKILEKEKFVDKVQTEKNKFEVIKINLKYLSTGECAIRSIKRVSKPGRRVYVNARMLPHVLNDLGIAIVSTPQGIMTNRDARKKHLGGEIVCEVY